MVDALFVLRSFEAGHPWLRNSTNREKILFYLNDNLISGDLPPGVGLLPNIRQLNLANNQITGAIPDLFNSGNSESLQWLDFSNNQFSSFPEVSDTFYANTFYNLYLSNLLII